MKPYRLYLLLAVALVAFGLVLFYGTPSSDFPPTGKFAGVSLKLDYATTTASRELGLGNRTSVPEDYGMLFVFPHSGYYGFWMKDTYVPLDIFWLDDKGQVVFMETNVATSTYPHVFEPTSPALYVLETYAGFARSHGVATGTPLSLKKLPKVSE